MFFSSLKQSLLTGSLAALVSGALIHWFGADDPRAQTSRDTIELAVAPSKQIARPVVARFLDPDRAHSELPATAITHRGSTSQREPAIRDSAVWKTVIEERLVELSEEFPPPSVTDHRVTASTSSELQTNIGRQIRHHLSSLPPGEKPPFQIAVSVRPLPTHRSSVSPAQTVRLRSDQPHNPASNQKLFTTIAAAELLGPGYRFETELWRKGSTLYLRGGGDPSLQVADLYDLLTRAQSNTQLEAIDTIIVDDTAFSPEQHAPGYTPQTSDASYQAPSGAASLHFNTVEVVVSPGEYGEAVRVQVFPPCANVQVENRGKTGSGRVLQVHSIEDRATKQSPGSRVVVDGSLPSGHAPLRVRRRIHHPSLFIGECLASVLSQQQGISSPSLLEQHIVPHDAKRVAVHRSAPLTSIAASALKYSNNFTSEQILRTLGWRANREPGSWVNGLRTLSSFWSIVGSAHVTDSAFENGSGLSREGRVTAAALTHLLALSRRPGSRSSDILPALAQSGGEGTMRVRLPFAGPRVRAKTGTLDGVTALSGFVEPRNDANHHAEYPAPPRAFSVLIHGGSAFHNRQLQDKIVRLLLDSDING